MPPEAAENNTEQTPVEEKPVRKRATRKKVVKKKVVRRKGGQKGNKNAAKAVTKAPRRKPPSQKQWTAQMIHERFSHLIGEIVTEEQFESVVQRLVKLCASKSERNALIAIRMFLEYTVGKPRQAVDMDVQGTITTEVGAQQLAAYRAAITQTLGLTAEPDKE